MNSLNKNLEKGQMVVMQGDGSEAHRTVKVIDGFGMMNFTAGTALFVKLADGTPAKMDGMEIEKIITNKE